MNFIEEMITKAQKRGEFDNLPGQGRPMQFDENPFNAEHRLSHKILKSGGYTPDFIQERSALQEKIKVWDAELERMTRGLKPGPFAELRRRKMREWLKEEGRSLNKKIRSYNLKAPSPPFQLIPIPISRLLDSI